MNQHAGSCPRRLLAGREDLDRFPGRAYPDARRALAHRILPGALAFRTRLRPGRRQRPSCPPRDQKPGGKKTGRDIFCPEAVKKLHPVSCPGFFSVQHREHISRGCDDAVPRAVPLQDNMPAAFCSRRKPDGPCFPVRAHPEAVRQGREKHGLRTGRRLFSCLFRPRIFLQTSRCLPAKHFDQDPRSVPHAEGTDRPAPGHQALRPEGP